MYWPPQHYDDHRSFCLYVTPSGRLHCCSTQQHFPSIRRCRKFSDRIAPAPPAKGTASADWRPFQSHRSGPLGLQHPSRFLRKYLTPTFIALQSWLCFADLRIFSRSLFRGHGVWRSQLTEMHPSSEYDVPKCWYSVVKMLGNKVLLFCPSLISQGNRLFYKWVLKFRQFYQFSSLYSAVLLGKLTRVLSVCSPPICAV